MKEYFWLQYKMINRKLNEVGIHPAIGYVISVVFFVVASEYVFENIAFAKYLVLFTALSCILKMSETNKNEFLQTVFGNNKTRIIRIAENLIVTISFIILLIYHNSLSEALLLIIISVLLASYTFKTHFTYTIPTPFYKKPFEFTVGFRNTFYIFPIAYSLVYRAIAVENLNLGIFAMFLVFFIASSYHSKPENAYFVWVHSASPKTFILEKLITATKYSSLLILPILISLIAFYPEEISSIFIFLSLGLLFLWTIILAKYSAYPNKINVPEWIIIISCMKFPPLLVVFIPFFYMKSIKKLNLILK